MIVSICGTATEGMSHSQAVTLLKNATGTIELQVSERLINVILPTTVRLYWYFSSNAFTVQRISENLYFISDNCEYRYTDEVEVFIYTLYMHCC